MSLLKSILGAYESLLKSAVGEGSRGGVVVGHTKSGKAIYDSEKHTGDMTAKEHRETLVRFKKKLSQNTRRAHLTAMRRKERDALNKLTLATRAKRFERWVDASNFYALHGKTPEEHNKAAITHLLDAINTLGLKPKSFGVRLDGSNAEQVAKMLIRKINKKDSGLYGVVGKAE